MNLGAAQSAWNGQPLPGQGGRVTPGPSSAFPAVLSPHVVPTSHLRACEEGQAGLRDGTAAHTHVRFQAQQRPSSFLDSDSFLRLQGKAFKM